MKTHLSDRYLHTLKNRRKFFGCCVVVVLDIFCKFAVPTRNMSVSRFRRASVIGSKILRAFFMPLQS